MVEKDHQFGGTTALSGGIPWIPGNRYGSGAAADPDCARTYLQNELGNRYDAAMIDAYLTSGSAPTIDALAHKLALDPVTLAATVARFNEHAARGADPDFQRGTTAYQRAMGDPTHGPNPALGPLERPPFYAVRLVPGDIGTSVGIRTSPDAEVLDETGTAIPGLYAVGNDMANCTVGVYPGPGVTLGPAMTFGYRAARHLAAVP